MIARNIDSNSMAESYDEKEQSIPSPKTRKTGVKQWYSIPEPIRRVFNRFPLVTYNEHSVPQRARRKTDVHTLYIFANILDGDQTNISCNPACVKWQMYLKFNDIEFSVASSNNHASPSGSLPFLLTASTTTDISPLPLTTGKIARWVSQQTMQEEERLSMKDEAYMSLIDHNIRNAWLYHLYLDPANFKAVAYPLYVCTASSNGYVQRTVAYQLREAAQTELLKSRHIIDRDDIYVAAQKAFSALSTLLDKSLYFSNESQPGLFDASVFAYTYLLLNKHLPWQNTVLTELLCQYQSLVDHQTRILKNYMNS